MDRLQREYVIVDVDTGTSRKVTGSFKLSRNLAVWELVSTDKSEIVLYSSSLLMKFQKIRDKVGKSIKINSGHRELAFNKEVGGYFESWHLFGRALDLGVPSGITVDGFHKICLEVMGHDSGVGVYRSWVHIDNGKHFRKDWR